MPHHKPWRLGTRLQLLLRGLRYSRLLPYASIDGWLTVDEAVALYELARALPDEHPLVVEIGCWQGKSSVCLARGLQGKQKPQLVCIDPFDASGDAQSTAGYAERAGETGDLRHAFEQNLVEAGVRELVAVRPAFSHDAAPSFHADIDLLFLDGDHSPAAVEQDYRDWAGKVRPGGFLVMHDVVHPVHEGPRQVVESLVKRDPRWVEHRYVDSMFVARRAVA